MKSQAQDFLARDRGTDRKPMDNTLGDKESINRSISMETLPKSEERSKLTVTSKSLSNSFLLQRGKKMIENNKDFDALSNLKSSIDTKDDSDTQNKGTNQKQGKRKEQNKERRNIEIGKSDIDKDIMSAELEVEIAKCQLKMMDLKQRVKSLKGCSLFNIISKNNPITLVRQELSRDHISCIDMRTADSGLEWNSDSAVANLKLGDKVLEVNGEKIPKISRASWMKLKERFEYPVDVMMRGEDDRDDVEKKESTNWSEDLILVQHKLEKKLSEEKAQTTKLKREVKERNRLERENTQLKHRIAFLEDQAEYFQLAL